MSNVPGKVILGMHALSKKEDTQVVAKIEGIFQHENYDKSDQDNDLMLLKVPEVI